MKSCALNQFSHADTCQLPSDATMRRRCDVRCSYFLAVIFLQETLSVVFPNSHTVDTKADNGSLLKKLIIKLCISLLLCCSLEKFAKYIGWHTGWVLLFIEICYRAWNNYQKLDVSVCHIRVNSMTLRWLIYWKNVLVIWIQRNRKAAGLLWHGIGGLCH